VRRRTPHELAHRIGSVNTSRRCRRAPLLESKGSNPRFPPPLALLEGAVTVGGNVQIGGCLKESGFNGPSIKISGNRP
jgi:hypothetical protein